MDVPFSNLCCKSWLAALISLERVSVFYEASNVYSADSSVSDGSQMVTLLN